MKYILKRIAGTEKYKVSCSSPSRICGRLMSEFSGAVYGVKPLGDDCFSFYCLKPYCGRILAFLDKYECLVESMSSNGIPMIVSRCFSRPGVLVGVLFALATMILCNGVVWDMEISGNEHIGDSEIEYTLASCGLSVGKRYEPKKLSSVCNRFIIADDRFTRIAINMSGNKAFVEVTERLKKVNNEEKIYNSGIVSQYDCIIERPEVFCGTALVKKGDVAEKGTVLIAPVEKGNNGNEYISGAKGKVYARTTESFTVTIPLDAVVVSDNGKCNKKSVLSFLGISAYIPSELQKTSGMYFCRTAKKKLCIGENIPLPIKLLTTEKRGYETENIRMDLAEAEKKAYETIYAKMSRELSECEILSTEFESVQEADSLTLCCRVECIRDVTKK